MADFLLELFSEEIPARMQARASDDLKKLVTDGIVERGLTYSAAAAFSFLAFFDPLRDGETC